MFNKAMSNIQKSLYERGFRECSDSDIPDIEEKVIGCMRFPKPDTRIYFGTIIDHENGGSAYAELTPFRADCASVAFHLVIGFTNRSSSTIIGIFDHNGLPVDDDAEKIVKYLTNS